MEGLSISFWCRHKFPAFVLSVVSSTICSDSQTCVRVIINGNTFFFWNGLVISNQPKTHHLHIFHMQIEDFNDNLDVDLIENKWNHVNIDFGFSFRKCGIHVLKKKSSMEDVQFTDPGSDVNRASSSKLECDSFL
jgi:hypothetical protein